MDDDKGRYASFRALLMARDDIEVAKRLAIVAEGDAAPHLEDGKGYLFKFDDDLDQVYVALVGRAGDIEIVPVVVPPGMSLTSVGVDLAKQRGASAHA